ncbi:hypothetical protein BMS3Abin09_00315 [bacterium BMS3Abin09]|nr:hypothetical protein BMS3Abin09_00315 [bacterium BMS3Abin09]
MRVMVLDLFEPFTKVSLSELCAVISGMQVRDHNPWFNIKEPQKVIYRLFIKVHGKRGIKVPYML